MRLLQHLGGFAADGTKRIVGNGGHAAAAAEFAMTGGFAHSHWPLFFFFAQWPLLHK
jgi:hypothetical protein